MCWFTAEHVLWPIIDNQFPLTIRKINDCNRFSMWTREGIQCVAIGLRIESNGCARESWSNKNVSYLCWFYDWHFGEKRIPNLLIAIDAINDPVQYEQFASQWNPICWFSFRLGKFIALQVKMSRWRQMCSGFLKQLLIFNRNSLVNWRKEPKTSESIRKLTANMSIHVHITMELCLKLLSFVS